MLEPGKENNSCLLAEASGSLGGDCGGDMAEQYDYAAGVCF